VLGLTAGLVPPQVDATVKAGLLALVEHAVTVGGWSARRAAATLGVDHTRLLRWSTRAAVDRLDDTKPGPDVALHALLDWERDAIIKVAEQ
jgi:putative transposase